MSILKVIVRSSARPYVEVAKGMRRVSATLRAAGRVSAGSVAVKDGEGWDNSESAKAAFVSLYNRNAWTAEQLTEQRRAGYRGKWTCIALTIAIFIFSLSYGLISELPYFLTALVVILCVLFMAIAAVRAYLLAVYQAQLDLEELITARQFFERPDMIQRIFS